METMNKSAKYARQYGMACYVSLLLGVYLGVQAVAFSTTATQMFAAEGVSGPAISILILISALLVPASLVLAGILGLLKCHKAGIVFSVIAIIASTFSLITNMTSLLQTTDWQHALGNFIPMISTVAVPILFVVYAVLVKKHPQK